MGKYFKERDHSRKGSLRKHSFLFHLHISLFFFLTCAVFADAIEAEPCFTPAREKTAPRYSKQPIVEEIQGILLIPHQDYVYYSNTKHICGLEVHDVCVPGGLECLREELEPYFMGQPLTENLLSCLKEQIVLYYRDHDRPVVAVYVPEQEILNGVVQIVVMEGCVGQIACSGNRWFPSLNYEIFFRLGPGNAITADTLLTDVAWLNRNPFRDVDVIFTPGCDPGTTNIELVICDRCPLQVYGGIDNTGTDVGGTLRYYVGATWGNAFWLDQILTYQYTTSKDFKEFQSHTAHWTIPLFWKHFLIAYGGYSVVDPDLTDITSDGKFVQASLRYMVPFGKNYDGKIQEWTLGFDFKNYNSNALFIGDEDFIIVNDTINLSQFMTSYAFACETNCQRFSFNVDFYYSPGKLLPNQSNTRYDPFSPHAKVDYIYGKMTVGEVYYLPWRFSFSALARLQLASQNLLPSERFGIGGYDTVRGYREREFLADNALVLNAEFRTPSVSLLNLMGFCTCSDELRFLAFFDYALAALHNRNPSLEGVAFVGSAIPKTEWFMSFGPGLRYVVNRYLSARLDWGIRLHHSIFSDSSRSRWHGGLVLSY
ncbi:MAG: Heme/hemopexin transporter protein HuxB [Chlamydiae bacterium]|nr:Heme/hemopexin transporter protein HuxB [Chlamydiota bacterium]